MSVPVDDDRPLALTVGCTLGFETPPGTPETPIMALPDKHLGFVMPSRFCLPDELGHEAWQRRDADGV